MQMVPFEEFLAQARRVHGSKYQYDASTYRGMSRKMRMVCPEHGEFWQYPSFHVKRGVRCKRCSYDKLRNPILSVEEAQKRLRDRGKGESFIEAIDWGTFGGVSAPITIVCPVHGRVQRGVFSALYHAKQACPRCAKKQISSVGVEEFLRRARDRFGDRYEYDLSGFSTMRSSIRVRCPEHGWFETNPAAHLNAKTGCFRCGVAARLEAAKASFGEFLATARKTHGDRYAYDDRGFSSVGNSVVKVYCDEHGWFEQSADQHLSGAGCPACADKRYVSSEEKEFGRWLAGVAGVEPQAQVRVGKLVFDFAVGNLLFDYHGSYWHAHHVLGDMYAHQRRILVALEHGYRLLQVFDFEFADEAKRRILAMMVRSYFGKRSRLGARACQFERRSVGEFLMQHHIAGHMRGCWQGALLHEGEVVAAMVCGRRNRRYEVLRYCALRPVVGGFARLFSRFRREVEPEEVVSFADARFFTGCSFRNAGFVLDKLTKPGYFYVKDGAYAGSRVKFQKHKLPQLLECFDKDASEYDNCLRNGYWRIYDAGHFRWVWHQPSLAN